MNVTLNGDLAKFIDAEVKAGRYSSADDAVNAAVARLQTEAALSEADIDDFRAELDEGIAQADRGEFVEFTAEDVIAERRSKLAERSKDQ